MALVKLSYTGAEIDEAVGKVLSQEIDPADLLFSATDKLLGRASAEAGAGEEIPCTAAGRALLDDADVAAQQATLKLAQPSHGTETFAMDVTDKAVLSIAADAIATPFSNANKFSGLMLITDQTNGSTALFLVGGTPILLLGATTAGDYFGVTKDTDDKTNVYVDVNVVKIQNTFAVTHTYYVMAFRTRIQL